ncbi:hypothetical protein MM326_18790 [Alkalihalobacillus sp. LMS6]|uniref:hypothetical protein n=1 Tax=Alkalihalobacillus sp. LMS6 TaxID=2924034 RepID=UPI0020CFF78F|nr:hypothetical protein [Alkalihalobacillus sp. LMS6]UTR06099.1 hypothetical protein MM326_18790 [Alkalihalobacillus sp. LMS6]
MKKLISFSYLAVCLLYVTACNENSTQLSSNNNADIEQVKQDQISVSFDYPIFDTLGDLATGADFILKGSVESSSEKLIDIYLDPEGDTEEENPGGDPGDTIFPYLVSDFKVTEVYYGDVEVGEILPIKQFGGEMDGMNFVSEDIVFLNEDEEYVVFLSTFDDSPAVLTNYTQGLYEINNEVLIPVIDEEEIKLEISLYDLESVDEIIEEYKN